MSDYWDEPVDESSGLLTHFVGQIEDSFWSDLAAETKGQATGDWAQNTQLFWHINVLDVLQGDYERDVPPTITINIGVGKKWLRDPENDDLVEHEDDTDEKPLKFHVQSGLGKVLALVAGKDVEKVLGEFKVLDGDDERVDVDMSGVADYFRKMGFRDARNAKIWEGLIFEFRGIGFPTRDNKNPRAKAYPLRFLGDDPEVITAAQTPIASAPEVENSPWLEFTTPAIAKTLNKLAANAASHEDFVSNALLLKDVGNNEALKAAVEDESNYNLLTGS